MSLVDSLLFIAILVAIIVILYLTFRPPLMVKMVGRARGLFRHASPDRTVPAAEPAVVAKFGNTLDPKTKERIDMGAGTYSLDTLITNTVSDTDSPHQSSNLESSVPIRTEELDDYNKSLNYEDFALRGTEIAQEGFSSNRLSPQDGAPKYGNKTTPNGDEEMYKVVGRDTSAISRREKELRAIKRAYLESRNEINIPFRSYYVGGVTTHKTKPKKSSSINQVLVPLNADEETGDVDLSDQGPIVSASSSDVVVV
jgi:hypothetical protein